MYSSAIVRNVGQRRVECVATSRQGEERKEKSARRRAQGEERKEKSARRRAQGEACKYPGPEEDHGTTRSLYAPGDQEGVEGESHFKALK